MKKRKSFERSDNSETNGRVKISLNKLSAMVSERIKVMVKRVLDYFRGNGNGNKAMEELLQARVEAILKSARTIDKQTKRLAKEKKRQQ